MSALLENAKRKLETILEENDRCSLDFVKDTIKDILYDLQIDNAKRIIANGPSVEKTKEETVIDFLVHAHFMLTRSPNEDYWVLQVKAAISIIE